MTRYHSLPEGAPMNNALSLIGIVCLVLVVLFAALLALDLIDITNQ